MEALSQSMETSNFLTTLPIALPKLLNKWGEKNLTSQCEKIVGKLHCCKLVLSS
jgi:hypothetical protein